MVEHQHIHSPAGDSIETVPSALHERVMSNMEDESIRRAKKDSEKRFRMLIEEAPDAFFVHDLKGRLLQVNKQTCKQTGYSRQELLSMTVSEIQRGVSQEKAKALWQKVLAGEMVLAEDVLMRKDGSKFPAEVKIGLSKSRNEIQILGFFRDISKRKQHEAEKKALIEQLQKELNDIKQLGDMLHICCNCHKIRDEEGYWNSLETYIKNHFDIDLSHGICPDCAKLLYPDFKIPNR